jgi:NAD(P)H-nitrite reductase large subunit
LFAVGDSSSDTATLYRTVELRDPKRRALESYHFLDDRLVGATLLGDVSKTRFALDAVIARAKYNEIINNI